MYFNHILFLKFNTLYLSLVKNFCNISMYVPCVMHLHEEGHMSDLDMECIILSHSLMGNCWFCKHTEMYLALSHSYKLAVI